MALTPGTRLGQYSITALIGSGGMGEVYRARDTRLGRDVAIKVLPAPFAGDHERLARFEREAQLLASLNHPHIAHIHGLEESDGVRALVMELVEGETLSDRIARGAIPIADVLAIADQVADALQFAHDHGVVHRDLKPANVKLTAEGAVKVLDFGLAKAIGGDASGDIVADASHSPTISIGSTRAGLILGTAAYMSPEQARGRAVDKRTDIWAFGCLVYECLTARKAFEGETVSDTIALILQREPDWAALPAGTPPGVRRLLARCLEKDAKKRLRDIGDARIEIDDARAGKTTAQDDQATTWPRRRAIAVAAALLVMGAAIGYFARGGHAPATMTNSANAPTLRLSVNTPPGIRVQSAALSPDGNYVVFMGAPSNEAAKSLYARRLDSFDVKAVPGTEGVTQFTFSTDGRRIAFVAPASGQESETKLASVPVDGSAPAVTITVMKDAWGSPCWLPDGDVLVAYSDGKGYARISAHGGTPVEHTIHRGRVTAFFGWSEVLPDGRGCLIRLTGWQDDGFHIDTAVLNLENDSLRVLVRDAGGAEYSATGNIVFARNDVLFAAPFDMAAQKTTGEPVALFNGLRTNNSWGDGAFYLSDTGTLMYPPGGRTGSNRRLVWIDDHGGTNPVTDERREFEELSARDDGKRVVVTLSNARGVFGLWMGEGSQFRPLQSFPGADCAEEAWSPDGRRIAFVRRGQTRDDGVYVMDAGGQGAPVRIVASVYDSLAYDPWGWSADGKSVLATASSARDGKMSAVAIPADGSGPARHLDLGPGNTFGPAASPDGRYIAFCSDVTGRPEVYVAELAGPASAATAVRVSQNGVTGPTTGLGRFGFRGPGQVYFVDRQNRLLVSALTTRPSLASSPPVVVADLQALRIDPLRIAALSDGRIMAIQNGEDEGDVTSYNVITSWSEALRAKMTAH